MGNEPCRLCGGTGWLARYGTSWVAYYSHGDPDLKPERVPEEEVPCPHVALAAGQEEAARLRERLETEVAFSMWLRPTDHWQILRDKFDRDDQCGCNEILRGMARTFLQGAPDPGKSEGGPYPNGEATSRTGEPATNRGLVIEPAGTSPPNGSGAPPPARPDLLEAAREMFRQANRKCADGFWEACTEHATCQDRQRWAKVILAAEEARRAGAPPPVAAPAEGRCPRCWGLKTITTHEDCSCTNPRCDSMVEVVTTCPDCTGAGKVPHDSGSAPTSEAPGPGKGGEGHAGINSGVGAGPATAFGGPSLATVHPPPRDPGASEDTEG